MRKLIWFIAVASIALNGAFLYRMPKEQTRRLATAYWGFATGCYSFAKAYCSITEDRAKCYQFGLDHCEDEAAIYRDWIAQGRK